ncbi:hypothetical protein CAC42_6713 [Sphaceloma murrayae]|uniref:Uncharacterized protein n=1 Tax=Sphaceloma murrayae TaxID=2082308 RepID=A0A2K1QH34_9PEZI|nr:hypothetical protein CAC42_6713 [Sphaceloma murrayae]
MLSPRELYRRVKRAISDHGRNHLHGVPVEPYLGTIDDDVPVIIEVTGQAARDLGPEKIFIQMHAHVMPYVLAAEGVSIEGAERLPDGGADADSQPRGFALPAETIHSVRSSTPGTETHRRDVQTGMKIQKEI